MGCIYKISAGLAAEHDFLVDLFSATQSVEFNSLTGCLLVVDPCCSVVAHTSLVLSLRPLDFSPFLLRPRPDLEGERARERLEGGRYEPPRLWRHSSDFRLVVQRCFHRGCPFSRQPHPT